MKRKKNQETATVDVASDESTEDRNPSSVTEDANKNNLTDVESASPDSEHQGEETVETLQAKVERLADSLLRAKADYKNLERRGIVERSDSIRYANAELMRSVLEVVDDFERSLAAEEANESGSAIMDGVKLIYDNLLKALTTHGLERIDALHQPFDPSIHEAMMQQPSNDYPPGTVLEELAKGYRLRDRVLRPSRVIVSSASLVDPGESSDHSEEAPSGSK